MAKYIVVAAGLQAKLKFENRAGVHYAGDIVDDENLADGELDRFIALGLVEKVSDDVASVEALAVESGAETPIKPARRRRKAAAEADVNEVTGDVIPPAEDADPDSDEEPDEVI